MEFKMLFFEELIKIIEVQILNKKILSNFNQIRNIDIKFFNDYYVIKRPIIDKSIIHNMPNLTLYFDDNSKLILSKKIDTHIYYSTPEYTSDSNIINIENNETSFIGRINTYEQKEFSGFFNTEVVKTILNNYNKLNKEETRDYCLLKHDICIEKKHEYIFFLKLIENIKKSLILLEI